MIPLTFDKEKFRQDVEDALVRVGRAGATAIVNAAEKELERAKNVLGMAKAILKDSSDDPGKRS